MNGLWNVIHLNWHPNCSLLSSLSKCSSVYSIVYHREVMSTNTSRWEGRALTCDYLASDYLYRFRRTVIILRLEIKRRHLRARAINLTELGSETAVYWQPSLMFTGDLLLDAFRNFYRLLNLNKGSNLKNIFDLGVTFYSLSDIYYWKLSDVMTASFRHWVLKKQLKKRRHSVHLTVLDWISWQLSRDKKTGPVSRQGAQRQDQCHDKEPKDRTSVTTRSPKRGPVSRQGAQRQDQCHDKEPKDRTSVTTRSPKTGPVSRQGAKRQDQCHDKEPKERLT